MNNLKIFINFLTKIFIRSKKGEKMEQRKDIKIKLRKPINNIAFPEEQYYKEFTVKTQIGLHHTVSGVGIAGDLAWWLATTSRIATQYIVGRTEGIYKLFNSTYWGHHLGIKSSYLKKAGFVDYKTRNVLLNKSCIGIELDSLGGLCERNVKYPD